MAWYMPKRLGQLLGNRLLNTRHRLKKVCYQRGSKYSAHRAAGFDLLPLVGVAGTDVFISKARTRLHELTTAGEHNVAGSVVFIECPAPLAADELPPFKDLLIESGMLDLDFLPEPSMKRGKVYLKAHPDQAERKESADDAVDSDQEVYALHVQRGTIPRPNVGEVLEWFQGFFSPLR